MLTRRVPRAIVGVVVGQACASPTVSRQGGCTGESVLTPRVSTPSRTDRVQQMPNPRPRAMANPSDPLGEIAHDPPEDAACCVDP